MLHNEEVWSNTIYSSSEAKATLKYPEAVIFCSMVKRQN